jgi:hypothetical protein
VSLVDASRRVLHGRATLVRPPQLRREGRSRKQVSDTSRAVSLSSGLVADADSAQRGSPAEYQFNLIDGGGERLTADIFVPSRTRSSQPSRSAS